MNSLLRFLLPIVIAGILGPLVGGIAVCVLVAGQYLADWPLGPITDLFGAFVFYVFFAFVLGWPIAVLAGVLMSIWMNFRAPSLVAAIAAAVGAVGLLWFAAATNVLGPFPNLAYGAFALTLGASVAAAIVCWFAVRPFVSRMNA